MFIIKGGSFMLGYLFQAIAQQIGPALSQVARRIPPAYYAYGAKQLSRQVSSWYNSLSPNEKERVDKVIFWVVKDVVADIVTMTTGLPLRPLVSKAFDLLKEYNGNSDAKQYVESEIKKQLESRSIKPL
jgi:hypothetical protein